MVAMAAMTSGNPTFRTKSSVRWPFAFHLSIASARTGRMWASTSVSLLGGLGRRPAPGEVCAVAGRDLAAGHLVDRPTAVAVDERERPGQRFGTAGQGDLRRR